jgi:hypothetical protein
MKMDFDTLIYIIISIVIVVLSALGSSRRRKAQQGQVPGSGAPSAVPGTDPLERLEQMFTGQLTEEDTGEPEIREEEEERQVTMTESPREELSSRVVSQPEKMPEEGQATIMPLEDENDSHGYSVVDPDELSEKEKRQKVKELFEDVDEIKKAVIYSEIFKRKYT